MGVFQQIDSKLHYKPNHLVIHFGFFIHIDGKIRLVGCDVHFFGIFEVAFTLKFSSFLNLDQGVFTFR
jgi:hypothetical protein